MTVATHLQPLFFIKNSARGIASSASIIKQ